MTIWEIEFENYDPIKERKKQWNEVDLVNLIWDRWLSGERTGLSLRKPRLNPWC